MDFMEEMDTFYVLCLSIFLALIGFLFLIRKTNFYRNSNSPKTKSFFWNLSITLTLIISVFLLGESYFRFFVNTTDSFMISKLSRRWQKSHVKYNNTEVRDNIDYLPQIGAQKRRISIIGDSFTQGQGIDDVEDRFGNLLRERFPNLEIHIFAQPGSNTNNQISNIKNLINSGYEFDMVILAYCLNDVDYFMPNSEMVYKKIHSFQNKLNYLLTESYFLNTMAFRFFAQYDSEAKKYSSFLINGYEDKIWSQEKNKLLQFKYLINKAGGSLVVLSFPFLQNSFENYQFKTAHEKINLFWKQQNTPHIDLLPVFKPYLGNTLTVNSWDAHPNEFAHLLVADTLDVLLSKK